MRTTFPCAALLALGVAAGCATSGTGTPSEGTRTENLNVRMNLQGAAFNIRTSEDIVVISDTIEVAPGRLWSEMPAAYDALGIPITTINTEARALGAVNARVRGKIGETSPSRYLRCGRSLTGDVADQYELYLTAVTQVDSAEGGGERSIVSTHVRADAVQGGYTSNTVRCATRGRLERDVHEQILLEIGKSGADSG